ncbi:DUF2145 domain-containing protein [Oleomonas cavernae]|uniref:DUF2145 domain-containing protein n=1 Tax=Oleomonas cavernae TaxID=2320859 RepID=A0A418WG46_9PROT|nr:DUF2145 domain-containing protein [Oleomonas cavernae]RJF88986.1 DUF2145 domain-containing protein [Oleomonas cavernae]
MTNRRRAAALALALAAAPMAAATMPAQASSLAGGTAPTFSIDETASFAKSVEKILAARGARVALVARLGRDPDELPAGIDYTHVGLWVYSEITTADGRKLPGYAVFNLYRSNEDPDHSSLVQDFPLDFFAEIFVQRAGVIIPTPEMQARLARVIASPSYARLHDPHYSLLANPLRDDYQNCTSFVLDVTMAAIYGTDDRRQIRANVEAYFEPTVVDLDPLRRLFGPLFVEGAHTDDQDWNINTATFGSLARFYETYGLAQEVFEVTPIGIIGRPASAPALD